MSLYMMIVKKRLKKIKNVDAKNQWESVAISNNILERMEVSDVDTNSQCSEEDEENFVFSTTIFDIFDEVKIKGDDNWLFRSLSFGAFGSEDSNDIAREMVCDDFQIHRNRFVEFIEDDFDNYIDH